MPIPVVSNTSPVLNLAIIGELSLLRDQFGEIWIPAAVFQELRVDEDLPGTRSIRDAIETGWIRIETVKQEALVSALQRDLDRGESEAIALAFQVKAGWVLMDEQEGRRAARSIGLRVMGVLGVLLRAQRDGRLQSLKEPMDKLRKQAGFHLGADLYDKLIRENE